MLQYLNLKSTDPAFNLAAEQFVLEQFPQDRDYFMLWQNDRAVIIGRYQNTLAEINVPYVEANGIKVVRRLSGGGAVYHDLGNLNFTFITDAYGKDTMDLRLFCEPVIRTLALFGAEAEVNGRNDLTIDGYKFSGNAQTIRHGRILHHGTILFDSDLDAVLMALRVDPKKIEGKGIRSVRSRVTNLRPYLDRSVTLPVFRSALLREVLSTSAGQERNFTEQETDAIREIARERYETWEWNYGRSPECTIEKNARFEGVGTITAYLTLDHGRICSAAFRGDYFSILEPQEMLAPVLVGRRLEKASLESAISGMEIPAFFTGLTKEQFLSLLLS